MEAVAVSRDAYTALLERIDKVETVAERVAREHAEGQRWADAEHTRLRDAIRDLAEVLKPTLADHTRRLGNLEGAPRAAEERKSNELRNLSLIVGGVVALAGACNGLLGVGVTLLLHFLK
jgi:hypothetical protein